MKTPRRNNNRSDGSRIKRARRPLKAEAESEAVHKAVDQALFQKEAASAWLENAGLGGVEDLYSR